jgi:hypothetical protein
MWKVAGYPQGFWPDRLVRPKVVGGCDPSLCEGSDEEKRCNGRIEGEA